MRRWVSRLVLLAVLLSLVGCQSPKEDPPPAGAPSVIGQRYEDVLQDPAFTGKYTFEKSEQFHNTVPEGVVSDQDPKPGDSMTSSVIRVVVSKGPRQASTVPTPAISKKVPDVTDEFLEKAVAALKSEGFTADLKNVTYVNHPSYNRGVVVSQSPSGGQIASTDTPVQFSVASGFTDATVTVPFPAEDKLIDLQILIEGKKQSEDDLDIPLRNLLIKDLPSLSFTTTVQKTSYKVEIQAATSGSTQFRLYATYTVNGDTGEVKQTGLYELP